MAKMDSAFPFTGTIDNMSFYKMRGVEGIVGRKKSGPTSKQVKESKAYQNPRRNSKEFGGRSTASKWLMRNMMPLKALADHNIAGELNKMLRPVQKRDTTSEWGRRSVLFSAATDLVPGFSFNKNNPFDSIVRTPVQCETDRTNLRAGINIPALLPGINFFVPWKYPLFSIQVTLGIIPDLFYDEESDKYKPLGIYELRGAETAVTDWHPVSKGSAATSLELNWPVTAPNQSFTMILGIGIRYGTIGVANDIDQLPHAGAAKILVME